MLAFALIVQVLFAAAALLLSLRIASARAAVRAATRTGGPLAATLDEVLRRHGEVTLWPALGAGGIGDLAVRHRELHDPYRTLDELLATIAAFDAGDDRAELERTIKAVYQLQSTIGLGDPAVERLLDAPLSRLAASGPHTIERVHRGAHVDRATMFPLTEGTRVVQPIGVLVRNRDGRVVDRAKVFCS